MRARLGGNSGSWLSLGVGAAKAAKQSLPWYIAALAAAIGLLILSNSFAQVKIKSSEDSFKQSSMAVDKPLAVVSVIDPEWLAKFIFTYPRVVEFVDVLPKSGSGKVMWRAL